MTSNPKLFKQNPYHQSGFPANGFSSNLVTKNLADDDSHFLVFDQIGQMAATTTYMHMMLPLNFSGIMEQLDFVNQSMHNFVKGRDFYKADNYYTRQTMNSQTKEILKALENKIAKLKKTVTSLDHILPFQETKNSNRKTRETVPESLPPPLTIVLMLSFTLIIPIYPDINVGSLLL